MPDWGNYRPREPEFEALRRKVERRRYLDQQESGEEKKRERPASLSDSNEHLNLFRTQELAASGEIFIKYSRFGRSRKYFAELRGATLCVFKSVHHTEPSEKDIDGVIAVLPLHQFNIDVVTKNDGYPRIYISPRQGNENPLMYVRVREEEIQAWCTALSDIISHPMPILNDLTIESVIGRGGGGKVFLTVWVRNKQTYALKVIDKRSTFKSARAFRHVASERRLMEKAGSHPFLLPMEFAFQSETNLFILTPFCPGGDLASYIRHKGNRNVPYDRGDYTGKQLKRFARLTEGQVRRIASEVLLGLEHLHNCGIVYRDLKPENVFIDRRGYLKIGDYGLAKYLGETKTGPGRVRTASMCGTRNYISPEMLKGDMYSFESDLWSYGVMIYRMLVGVFPFDAGTTKDVFTKIQEDTLRIPKWLSGEARRLLQALLNKDPSMRVTIEGIKKMAFFKDVNWEAVAGRRSQPSVPDVDAGTRPLDALMNFELSKLYGITLGEFVGPIGYEPEVNVAYHRRDPRTMMIGFEYVRIEEEMKGKGQPVVVRACSGGLLQKLASIDKLGQNLGTRPLSPRIITHFPGFGRN